MAPPARNRKTIPKSDNIQPLVRKTSSVKYSRKDNRHGAAQQKEQQTKINPIIPGADTAFKAFMSVRICSAIWQHITDCDETFNYWEPLHYLIYGQGLQTWEYSPEYAIRSYTYLMIHGVPAWIYHTLFTPSPTMVFYFIRFLLAIFCAMVEVYFYKAISREFGVQIGRLWLIFQIFSPGMFIAGTALLPSSFSMYLSTAGLAAWWHQKYSLSIFLIAVSTLLGWPFAALIGLPICYDVLVRQRMWRTFLVWTLISACTILIPECAIDSYYFGRLTIAPVNIILYNVFSTHGPNLYGTEPFSYYLINGFLNFNLIWLLALITPIMLVLSHFFVPAKSKSTLSLPHYISLAPFYLWLAVFFLQPHKEERFLFPIYPLLVLCGTISLDIFQKLFFRIKSIFRDFTRGTHYLDHTMFLAAIVLMVSVLFSLSRIYCLYTNYRAPFDLMMDLNTRHMDQQLKSGEYNVCIGKDWYRFPSSFFLPTTNYRIRFVRSEFKGILPAYYNEMENGTRIIHPYFNDLNLENEYMYTNVSTCHFMLDTNFGRVTDLEPDYSQSDDWTVIKSVPFIDSQRSHRFFRAFYIPVLNERYVTYGEFNLLQRTRKH